MGLYHQIIFFSDLLSDLLEILILLHETIPLYISHLIFRNSVAQLNNQHNTGVVQQFSTVFDSLTDKSRMGILSHFVHKGNLKL
jgi:hypothetical protein